MSVKVSCEIRIRKSAVSFLKTSNGTRPSGDSRYFGAVSKTLSTSKSCIFYYLSKVITKEAKNLSSLLVERPKIVLACTKLTGFKAFLDLGEESV
jgi:hypothetical protein